MDQRFISSLQLTIFLFMCPVCGCCKHNEKNDIHSLYDKLLSRSVSKPHFIGIHPVTVNLFEGATFRLSPNTAVCYFLSLSSMNIIFITLYLFLLCQKFLLDAFFLMYGRLYLDFLNGSRFSTPNII